MVVNGVLATLTLVVVLAIYARRYQRFVAESAAGRIGTGLLLGMIAFALVWIAQLPFGIAALAWERHHGVSKQDYLEWALDSWLALGAEFLFICMALAIVMALARPFRRTWWIPGAVVFTALALLAAFVSPYLFPDVNDLDSRAIRTTVAQLAETEGVEGVEVSVQEVKEFTTVPNAGATGFGPTKRVILWDTLISEPFTQREIRPVIAHEIAHLKHDHVLKSVALFALFAFPLAYAIAVVTRRRGGMYEPAAVPLAILVLTLLSIAASPLQNAFSRRWETEADWTALEATRNAPAQRDAMRLLATTSKTHPDPPAIEELFLGTHPAILDRIALTRAWELRAGD